MSPAPAEPDRGNNPVRFPIFPSIRNKNRNQLIDALRGLSILLVVASHYGLVTHLVDRADTLFLGRSVWDLGGTMGYYGVVIFFVISGFLITSISLKRYGDLPQVSFAGFWWMRFSRVMPMLLVCMAAMALWHYAGVVGFIFKDRSSLARTLASLLCFQFNHVSGLDPATGAWAPLWSLSVEEMFYLAFPFVCLCLTGPGALAWLGTLVLAGSAYCQLAGISGPYEVLGCMGLMALGCLLAIARPERLRARLAPARAKLVGLALALGGLGVIGVAVIKWHPIYKGAWAPLVCGLGAVAVLVAAHLVDLSRTARRALLPLSVLGVVSYEVYLLHWPLYRYAAVVWPIDGRWFIFIVIGLSILAHELFAEPMNLTLRALLPGGQMPGAAADEAARTARRQLWRRLAGLAVIPVIVLLPLTMVAMKFKIGVVAVRIGSVSEQPAGASEPMACVWRLGSGDLVFLRHDAPGMVSVGVNQVGHESQFSASRSISEITGQDLLIEFQPQGIVVRQGPDVLLQTTVPPQHLYGRVVMSRNDEGFPAVAVQAVSSFRRIE